MLLNVKGFFMSDLLNRDPNALYCDDPSLTEQSFKKDCDINYIMAQFKKTGLFSHVSKYHGKYEDFTGYPDYHEAMNIVAQADEMFMTLPADIRARFDNDPGAFIEFVDNPDNAEEMRKMGLMEPIIPSIVSPGGAESAAQNSKENSAT